MRIAVLLVLTEVAFIMALLLSGCGEPPALPTAEKPAPYVNKFGQTIEDVQVADWRPWLDAHKDCEIISLTSYSGQMHPNPTTCFVVVYKRHE